MVKQKSAGIVLFQNFHGTNHFLLLNYPQGHWDFVKGNVMKHLMKLQEERLKKKLE